MNGFPSGSMPVVVSTHGPLSDVKITNVLSSMLEFFQRLEYLAARPVDLFDRVAVESARRLAFELLRRTQRNVRHVVGEVQEERLFAICLDPLDRFARVVGRDVIPALDRFDHDFLVAHDRSCGFSCR